MFIEPGVLHDVVGILGNPTPTHTTSFPHLPILTRPVFRFTCRPSGALGYLVHAACYKHAAPLGLNTPMDSPLLTFPLSPFPLRLCVLALNILTYPVSRLRIIISKKPLINQPHRNNITQATTQPMNFCVLCTAALLRCFSYVLHLPFSRSLVLSVFFESFFYTPAFCCLGLY